MKRILCILLCLLMIFGISACKPDNITYPTTVTPPEDQPATEQTDPAPPVQQPEENTTEEATGTEPPTDVVVDSNTQPEQPAVSANPLAAEGFVPSTGTLPTLQSSGIIKEQGNALSVLKNRTIVLYTANDQPAFTYTDAKGNVVTEWQWMENIAAENGFILKYSIKPKSVSLKAQRVALYSGKRLSLLQMGIGELAAGLGLSASSFSHLNLDATTYGISKAVLNQSGGKLFAPIGNANTLWYNPAALSAEQDPQTLSKNNQWTLEQFKTAQNYAAAAKIMPLIMSDPLAWATLSGKSPLTLLEGKLDSNINAQVTRNVWASLRTLKAEQTPFVKEEGVGYSIKNGNAAFEYTNNPVPTDTMVLKYAPLPAVAEGTAGTATFTGTFMALPKYETNEDNIHAALSFAELWCNRFTESRAAKLQSLGIAGADYQKYCDMTEAAGMLILRDSEIEKAAEAYLGGLDDPTADMDALYSEAKPRIDALVATRNIYY